MIDAQLQIGTENALPLLISSDSGPNQFAPVQTTGDLLEILDENPPRGYAMLRTTCGLLGRYLDLPGNQIPFDMIELRKCGFRPFLQDRRYTEASIRSYVYQQRRLLKAAMQHGWDPDGHPNEVWKPLCNAAVREHLTDIVRYFARSTKSPKEVTKESVDAWGEARIRDGLKFTTVAIKKNHFWSLLVRTGWLTETPNHLRKFNSYSIPLKDMTAKLREDIQTVLKWKQAKVARNRPKYGKIRAVTANNVRLILQQLTSYVINVCGSAPQSLSELIQPENIEGFIEWMLNERNLKGQSLEGRLASILAIVKYHPMFEGRDFTWFKTLIDGIPVEDDSERKKRKAAKYVDYDELETIPAQIHAYREAYEKSREKSPRKVAQLAMEELIFRWFLVFPWRQRNLRECSIGGTAPNLFKARISPLAEIDKPQWVIEEEAKNPVAEFWQICFASSETKTHISVDLLVPRHLIQPLEEYLEEYRPLLLHGNDPGTLFLSQHGKPMRSDQVGHVIGHWTTRFACHRTTPHIIRDSFAYKWLKEHPKDYLTLSKILWHKNVQTTIGIYGARFNESSGMCAMEAWLDQRVAQQK